MDTFEARLKSLPLRKPSAEFGKAETLAKLIGRTDNRNGLGPVALRRRKYVVTVAIAACVIAAFVALLPGSNDSRVLAKALDKVRAATSLKFDSVVKIDGKVSDISREFYMPPGLYRSHFTSPGYDEAYAVISVPADGLLIVNLERCTAELSFFNTEWGERYLTQTIIETLRRLDISNARPLGEKMIDGVRAQGFEVIGRDAIWDEESTFVLWTNPKTNSPVRVEITEKDNMGRDVAHVWSNIVFGEELDPQLFSLTVPDGYKLVPYEGHSIESSSPAGLVAAFLKLYSSQNQGQFPTNLEDAYPKLSKQTTAGSDGQSTGADAKLTFLGSATATVTNSGNKGESWDYYPDRTLGRRDQIVFWNFDDTSNKYLVVFADLHVERLSKQKLFEIINGAGK